MGASYRVSACFPPRCEPSLTVVLGILAFFLILATLIMVHELGHFTCAKLMGVRVEEFGLGFPPRLKGWKRGGTVYSLNAIPIGGFVKMLGENGSEAEPDSFGAKAPWKRFIILIAGPTMNLTLAVVIFFFAFLGGYPRGLTTVTGVAPGSPAAQAGLRTGDTIVAVDGKRVKYSDDLRTAIMGKLGTRVQVAVRRGSRVMRFVVVPRVHPPRNQGAVGVALYKTVTLAYSPGDALKLSLQQVSLAITSIPTLIQSVSQHGGSGVSGPIGIAYGTTQVVKNEPKTGFGTIFEWMAILSASLGILNLLPIPALDGGRIAFVLLSWVRRRNLDPELEGVIHMIGMAVLLVLILVISYQDVVRWVTGGSF